MMDVSFGRKLKSLGGVRVGYHLRGKRAWYFIIAYGFIQLIWYMILGSLWLGYGIGYLFFYLPIKGIIKLVKSQKEKSPQR